jgi:hypothetical protein
VVSRTEGIWSVWANAASAVSLRATSPPAMKEIWLRRSANWLLTGVAERSSTLVRMPAEMMSSWPLVAAAALRVSPGRGRACCCESCGTHQ